MKDIVEIQNIKSWMHLINNNRYEKMPLCILMLIATCGQIHIILHRNVIEELHEREYHAQHVFVTL